MCINTGEVEIAGLSDEKQNQFSKVHNFSPRGSLCTCTYVSFFDRSAKIARTKQTARKPTPAVRRIPLDQVLAEQQVAAAVPLDQVLAEQQVAAAVPLDQVIAEQQVAAAVPLDQVIAEQQVAAATLVRAEIAEAQRQHQLWLTSETAAARIETMVRFFISHFSKLKPILEIVSINL